MQESPRDPEQVQLMDAFLGAVADLSPQEVEAATGISWMSVTNYRNGEWKRLTARIQRSMRAYLESRGRPADASPGWDEGYQAALGEMEAFLATLRVTPGATGAQAAVEDATAHEGGGGRYGGGEKAS